LERRCDAVILIALSIRCRERQGHVAALAWRRYPGRDGSANETQHRTVA